MEHINRARIFGLTIVLGFSLWTSAESGVRLEPYGYIKVDAAYDSRQTAFGDWGFFVWPQDEGSESEFSLSVRETRFGVRLSGIDVERISIRGVAEGDLYGGGPDVAAAARLRLAYIDLAWDNGFSLRGGQDWDAFVTFHPRMIDTTALGFSGHIYGRRPQARATQVVEHSDSTSSEFRIAAARTAGATAPVIGHSARSDTPTLQGGWILRHRAWSGRDILIGITGHFGREIVDIPTDDGDQAADRTGRFETWSSSYQLHLPISAAFTAQGAVWTGSNLDSYIGGIGQGVNFESEREIRSTGGWAQLLYNPLEELTLTVGYGQESPRNSDLEEGSRSQNERWFTNAFYALTPDVTIAGEYSYLSTEYLSQSTANAHRIQWAIRYDF